MLDIYRARQAVSNAADSLAESGVVYREIESRLLERLACARLNPSTIADIGSGRGAATTTLMSMFPNACVFAVDHALPMLTRTPPESGVFPICADALSLPFADCSFDLIFSSLLLPWCPYPGTVLDEFRRLLKPGGTLWFSTFGPDTLCEARAAWSEVDRHPHIHDFIDMHHLGDALLAAGLSDPVMDTEKLTVTYSDTRALMREIKSLGAQNAHVDRFRRLTGRGRMDRFIHAYEKFRQADRIPASCEVIYGHAWGPPEGKPQRLEGVDVASFSVESLRQSAKKASGPADP